MANLRIIIVLALVVAWWQKDTLEDRALTHDGITAGTVQAASRVWSTITPPSPAKTWIAVRDEWLDNLFNPKQDYSHPASRQPLDVVPIVKKEVTSKGAAVLRPDPPHTGQNKNKDTSPSPMEAASTPKTTEGKSLEETDNVPETKEPEGAKFSARAIKRILIVGDSMIGDVGLSLRQLAFKYKQKEGVDVQIIDAHRHSTGLVVPSYYDWPRELPSLLSKNEPQVVVFMVGANDGQSMRLENQSWVLPGSNGWSSEYERRAKQVAAAIPPNAKLVWLDLPPVRLKSLQEKTAQVNASVKTALASCKNCLHLETRAAFGGDTYVENTPSSMLRSKDGIHYSRSGASLVASKIWTQVGLPIHD